MYLKVYLLIVKHFQRTSEQSETHETTSEKWIRGHQHKHGKSEGSERVTKAQVINDRSTWLIPHAVVETQNTWDAREERMERTH